MRNRRPWYGFLYYLLGAQGTFYLWVACVLGLYLTRKEAILYLFNREPVHVSVEDVANGRLGLSRWVRLGGVELDLGSLQPLLEPDAQRLPPRSRAGTDTILFDPDTEAASTWRELFERIERLSASPPADPEAASTRLWEVVQPFRREPDRFLPHHALVVVPGGDNSASRDVTATAQIDSGTFARARLEAWLDALHRDLERHVREAGYDARLAGRLIDRFEQLHDDLVALRTAVRLGVQREGLLHRLPASRREHYRSRYRVEVAPFALVTGQRPHGLAAAIFGIFAFFLFFLVVGLFALRRPSDGGDENADARADAG